MKLIRKAGATSNILQVFIQDSSSTVGAGLTGLAYNSGSLTAYYHRDTDTTATAISLVTMTVGTFTSSGFKEIDATNMPGWYQFCPPDAALASGAKSVGFHLKGATNMAPLPIEVDLWALDPQAASVGQTGDSYARLGAPAGASVSADVAAVKTDSAAIKTQTDKLTFTVANQIDANVLDWKSATAPAMTGDAFARLGAPAGASVSADVAAVKSDTGTILADVNTGAGAIYTRLGAPAGASIAADIAALPTAANVKTQVVNALTTDTYAEPSAVPAATSSLKDKIGYLFTKTRNKSTQTATTQLLRNDSDTATIATVSVSDDTTTFVKGADT